MPWCNACCCGLRRILSCGGSTTSFLQGSAVQEQSHTQSILIKWMMTDGNRKRTTTFITKALAIKYSNKKGGQTPLKRLRITYPTTSSSSFIYRPFRSSWFVFYAEWGRGGPWWKGHQRLIDWADRWMDGRTGWCLVERGGEHVKVRLKTPHTFF